MIGDKRKPRTHRRDLEPAPSAMRYEPLPESAGKHEPARVRHGADKWITHEVVEKAMEEWRKRGKGVGR